MEWKRYLLWFAHEHIHFRVAEINSLLELFSIQIQCKEYVSESKPYWIVDFPSEESVLQLSSRSVSIKKCIELWSHAKTRENLHLNLKKCFLNTTKDWLVNGEHLENSYVNDVCPNILIKPWTCEDISFKVEIETFCKHYTMNEKINMIEEFDYMPIKGSVKLKNPDAHLMYLEYYGTDPNNIPDVPLDVFFGRLIADGQRDRIQKLSLKSRKFIGNTSMDPQLSLLMANQALIKKNDLVLDPFVGSGSLLVAAAEFGAYVWGSDIDFLMIHARTKPTRVRQKKRCKDESIKANLQQYQLESHYLDVFVSDFSLPVWRDNFQFDAIITDPPYGVREPTERIGIEKENYTLAEEHLSNHIPSKIDYGLNEIFRDLLQFSAQHLKIGGRLVCWFPLVRNDYNESNLPSHRNLRLVGNSEQVLSKLTSRRLLTYEKIGNCESHTACDDAIDVNNFREKFFALSKTTRKERKQLAAAELQNYLNRFSNSFLLFSFCGGVNY